MAERAQPGLGPRGRRGSRSRRRRTCPAGSERRLSGRAARSRRRSPRPGRRTRRAASRSSTASKPRDRGLRRQPAVARRGVEVARQPELLHRRGRDRRPDAPQRGRLRQPRQVVGVERHRRASGRPTKTARGASSAKSSRTRNSASPRIDGQPRRELPVDHARVVAGPVRPRGGDARPESPPRRPQPAEGRARPAASGGRAGRLALRAPLLARSSGGGGELRRSDR